EPGPVARLAARTLHRSRAVDRLIAASDADVFVVSMGDTYSLVAFPRVADVLARCGRPVVVVAQFNHEDPLPPGVRGAAAATLQRAAKVVFVSERNRRAAERQTGCRLPNAVVHQNPINLPSFDPIPWPAGTGRLACVARLEVYAKGQDVLFETLAAPEWADRDWTLTLFGTGRDQDYLAALAKMYRIDGRVTFAGQVTDMAKVWADHHLLVLPSRGEGTPLALLEAVVAGRPAVVTDVGGSADWVDDGASGFVADAATPRSLGRALARAWERERDWPAMGQAACGIAARIDRTPGATLLDTALQCLTART
ncbi:MAG: glycosyltransferase family 4 protein, partial [Gemmataceae bacterium]|nr:glycosyltransferase family 4 protein [Gemmataceae bacterium]